MIILTPFIILGALGILFALLLGFASKKFEVQVDRRVLKVRETLLGANCGACGFPGCDGLADAIVNRGAPCNSCPVGGKETVDKLAALMGADAVDSAKQVACVMCQGTSECATEKFKYKGTMDCRVNRNPQSGSKTCLDGCLGCGSCVDVRDFDAIHIVNDIALVDREKCTSCKKCIEICSRNIIKLVNYDQDVYVRCSSHDKGKDVRQYCKVGCIACGICAKMCPDGLSVEDNLAYFNNAEGLDPEQVQRAVDKCPTKAIYPGLKIKEKQVKVRAQEVVVKET